MGASKGRTWPGGIIPYTVDPNFTSIIELNEAFAAWEEVTNLRFIRRLSRQKAYIVIQNSDEPCESAVGYQGNSQIVRCSPLGFGAASYIHELGHAVGMIHEHQRSDRDNFVRRRNENIKPGKEHNFVLERNSRNGPTYDFRSIMHYQGGAFSNGDGPTIVPLVAGTVLDGSTLPTTLDIQWINTEYPTLGVVRRSDSGRRMDEEIEEIDGVAIAPFEVSTSRFITAVKMLNGRLRLIIWEVSQLGGIARAGDSGNLAGQINAVDIARCPSNDTFVTAIETYKPIREGPLFLGGNLKLISWRSTNGNTIERLGDSGNKAGPVTGPIRIVALTDTEFVTACEAADRRLLLISWRLNDDGSFTRLADSGSAAGQVNGLELIRVRNSGVNHLVATTVKVRESGRLRVILWNVNANSGSIERRGDSGNRIGVGQRIAMAIAPSGYLLVSCQTSTNILRVISFSISENGRSVTRCSDSGSLAGRIGLNALVARPYGAVSAVATAANDLKLIKWAVGNTGQITRAGDSGDQAGNIGTVAVSVLSGVSAAPIVTAVEAGDQGQLKILSWDDLSATGELIR